MVTVYGLSFYGLARHLFMEAAVVPNKRELGDDVAFLGASSRRHQSPHNRARGGAARRVPNHPPPARPPAIARAECPHRFVSTFRLVALSMFARAWFVHMFYPRRQVRTIL